MDLKQLREFLPDLDAEALSRTIEHPDGRAAAKDLDQTLSELTRRNLKTNDRADWEKTRDELLDEIRRLTLRLSNGP